MSICRRSRQRRRRERRRDRRPAQPLYRDPGAVRVAEVHSVQPVLEDLSGHRAAGPVARPVHSHAMGGAGGVIDVPVEANTPVKQGDVLFRIDPTTYEAQVQALEAQLKLQEQRLAEMTQLQTRGTGRAFDVEQRQAEVDQLRAQVDGAQWNLDKTIVRAPADGYVTNLALRKGARVTAQSPVMAFIDTADTIFGAEIAQSFARYIEPGQPVEATFKMFPGRVFTGRVETVIQAVATGQAQVSGSAVAPAEVQAAPFVVRIRLDDETIAERLPAGSTASVAIFTDHIKASHVIRQVLLRQTALVNYVLP